MLNEIIKSWEENASEWIKSMDTEAIPSRRFTNKAILELIAKTNSKKIIDIGCGEGWLTRALNQNGKVCTGIDANSELLQHARSKGTEEYHQLSFEAIEDGVPIPGAPYQLAVLNFCLYYENIQHLLEKVVRQIDGKGICIIQTLHPYFLVQSGKPYRNQWIENSWAGLPGNFKNGHSWFARTFEGWSEVLNKIENTSFSFQEVIDDHKKPISLIIQINKIV